MTLTVTTQALAAENLKPPLPPVLYSPPPVLADSVRTPQIRAESVWSLHGVRTDCSDHVS
jgi:hypothetical protein